MLRILRIIGIVIFALLIGLSANSLANMYDSGQLMEKYNSGRKANITLLGISLLALVSLGYFELSRGRRGGSRRGYGGVANKAKNEKDSIEGLDSTCIYSAPKTQDAWQNRRTRGTSSRSKQQLDMTNVWMGMLRICCLILPVFYLGLLVLSFLNNNPDNSSAWLIPTLFSALLLFSLITASGLFSKKPWGMTLGYILAIFNLLIFPFGTAVGLFLLMGLVGATPLFAASSSKKRRKARRKAAKKTHAALI